MATELLPDQSPPPAVSESNPEALYEIVDGERVELENMAIYSHQVATRLFRNLIQSSVEQRGFVTIEALFILDFERDLRRRPDVAFVSHERWPADQELPETGDWQVIPNLCVEVTSPHDLHQNVVHKLQEYFEYGVAEVWQVMPEDQQVHIYEAPDKLSILKIGDTIRNRALLPEFEISLQTLFDRKP